MKKRAVAYCRVSTKKEEQLESLANQQELFRQYFEHNPNYELCGFYIDEGISGKSLKNRKEFNRMIIDAKQGLFDAIFTKDISRFSRNTVDLLTSIETLKDHGITVMFLNNNMDNIGNELTITLLAALAEHEITNMSIKTKSAKNMSAKEGRVPNFVYGYDRKDKYTLIPNKIEASWVRKIFELYVYDQMGTAKIAEYLNSQGVITKKGNENGWTQRVIASILRNQIYIGKVINKKSEIINYKTGKRKVNSPEEHIVVERPEFRIIEDDLFERAQKLLNQKQMMFKTKGKRASIKYPLSNLLVCANDNYSFRRNTRKYTEGGKLYVWWTCSYRNSHGASSCNNKVRIDEEQMHQTILAFFSRMIEDKEKVCRSITKKIQVEIEKRYKQDETIYNRKQLSEELRKLHNSRNRLLDLYADNIFTKEELKNKEKEITAKINTLEYQLKLNSSKGVVVQDIERKVRDFIAKLESTPEVLDNVFLKSIFEKFVVYDEGKVEAVLKIGDITGDSLVIPFISLIDTGEQTVPFSYNRAHGCSQMEWLLKVV